jgi:glucokinase
LYGFVSGVVGSASGLGTIAAAAVAVAGMVEVDRCNLTNWRSDSVIEVCGLETAGLPHGQTRLVNDVVAGAWGALARLDCEQPSARPFSSPPGMAPGLRDGSLVYVAPGTGLGAATLVRHGLGPFGATALGCEGQHTQVPRFEGDIGRVVDLLAQTRGTLPTWEELVSGRGLVAVYRAQCSIAQKAPLLVEGDDALEAGSIAAAALQGDSAATAATDVYYRTLGHFAQLLAMTHLPCAVVVIGGASTEQNLELMRRSGLADTFATLDRFDVVVGAIPIYTVDGQANLEGAVWMAAREV